MNEKQKTAEPVELSPAQTQELVKAYTAAYVKARQAMPQQGSVPQPGVPEGQGVWIGTDEAIAQRLAEKKITTREGAEELAEELAYQDARLPQPAAGKAGKAKEAKPEAAKAEEATAGAGAKP